MNGQTLESFAIFMLVFFSPRFDSIPSIPYSNSKRWLWLWFQYEKKTNSNKCTVKLNNAQNDVIRIENVLCVCVCVNHCRSNCVIFYCSKLEIWNSPFFSFMFYLIHCEMCCNSTICSQLFDIYLTSNWP